MPRSLVVALALLLVACTATVPDSAHAPELTAHAHAIAGEPGDYDPLFSAIGDASLVLLGEATHGTHEFYVERARITRRLITEKGFAALALEAQWADAARVDRYVRGESADRNAIEALGGFEDFPRWMWRNREFADLVEWIRDYNDALPPDGVKVGVYGLDLYGLEESRKAVREYLSAVDPAFAAEVSRLSPERQLEAIGERRERAAETAALDQLFFAEQNARVVRNADEYYREGRLGRVSTWNIRDRHMIETLAELQRYLIRRNGRGRVAVWAHNSHVGDARATGRARYGEWNIGQLVREHWPAGAGFNVGFMTHTGTVMAAKEWGGVARVQTLRPSIRGSHGAILHAVALPRFLIVLADVDAAVVRTPRPQRAVGVIYRPETEYRSHYFDATLAEQFDAVIHIDETRALEPLDR